MPPIRRSINGFLQETAQLIPVDRQVKPTLLQAQGVGLQPTMSFRPSPLADRLVGVDVFALSVTLAGVEDTVTFTSLAVPREEVHRYLMLGVSHDHGSARQFSLVTAYRRGAAGLVFASGRDVLKSLQDQVRTNMLATQGSADNESMSFNSLGLDIYPGQSFVIVNTQALAALSSVTLQGWRQRMRGPVEVGGVDASADIGGAAS